MLITNLNINGYKRKTFLYAGMPAKNVKEIMILEKITICNHHSNNSNKKCMLKLVVGILIEECDIYIIL